MSGQSETLSGWKPPTEEGGIIRIATVMQNPASKTKCLDPNIPPNL
jgi:hypothetical protein